MKKLINVFFEVMLILWIFINIAFFFGWLFDGSLTNLLIVWEKITTVFLFSVLLSLIGGGNENQ